jgi:hypothetical protein
MKEKAESAKDEDAARAQIGTMLARYHSYLKAR